MRHVPFTIIGLTFGLAGLNSTVGTSHDPVIAAAGDVACSPTDSGFNNGAGTAVRCHQRGTSDLVAAMPDVAAVLGLGDLQYEKGELANYLAVYDPTWGRVKAITRPSPGNHEYKTAGAAGYFAYWGAAAGDPAQGFYSFDVGEWHVIALNSNCDDASGAGCDVGSPQVEWLEADLAAHPRACTLAFWHHPRFTYGGHGSDGDMQAFWNALYTKGADVVLNGHDHLYERTTPLNPFGVPDPLLGIREFVVGSGGKSHYGWSTSPTVQAQADLVLDAKNNTEFGVLRLTLRAGGYDWEFVGEPGGTFTDAGSGACH